ncbi:tigger transposable element-derived protein 6 [Rhipicephalus microplus]|uniref:tigger transposable element-derived protein 6 n=1 Tax=Rhipicephalus microplus TaxID=6941 RepID=UPI003F6B2B22
MVQPAKKRKFLSLENKARIIAQAKAGKKALIAEEFGIAASSLSTILKSKDAIGKALASGTSAKHKKVTQPVHEALDKAVYTWFVETRAKKIALSGDIVRQKAMDFACMLGIDDFKASVGWLNRFKSRHSIIGKVLCGEAASADKDGAAAWMSASLGSILKDYASSDIYNADETGLFYEMLPNKTLDFKGLCCQGGKHSKKRITVLLCANMDGSDKRPLLVIGKSAKPCCFKGNRRLPVKYVANSRAWMTRAIFGVWVEEFDRDMGRQGRKVCLLLDNCSAHSIEDTELENVQLKFLPPNCTSIIQPLDQGVIQSVKCAYCKRLIQRLILNTRLGRETKIDLFMALQMIAASWCDTGSAVVANCFRHAGFAVKCAETSDSAIEAYDGDTDRDEDRLLDQDEEIAVAWADLQETRVIAAASGLATEDVRTFAAVTSFPVLLATAVYMRNPPAFYEAVTGVPQVQEMWVNRQCFLCRLDGLGDSLIETS